MTDFSKGDEFQVSEDTIRVDGYDLPVDKIKINSIRSDNSVEIIYTGSHPELPKLSSVTASDISQALGDWLEEPEQ